MDNTIYNRVRNNYSFLRVGFIYFSLIYILFVLQQYIIEKMSYFIRSPTNSTFVILTNNLEKCKWGKN